ncbi:hypothetical protein Bca4012_038740 [Brassica carinata]
MPGGTIPDLLPFFSTKVYSGYSDTGEGFYEVYSYVFDSVYLNEVNFEKKLGLRMDSVREAPPGMGSLESPYAQVKEFYSYWLGFSTVMDFSWVDEFDVMAEPDGWIRKKMKEENDIARKNAKREYNQTVRSLAAFVKKSDKRVVDMRVQKNAEMEVKKAEERERKKNMDKERLERAMDYKEPDWAKAQASRFSVVDEDDVDEGMVLYCIVCSKKFKSEKQWKNHEQSKKHKEIVAELRVEAPETETVEEFYEKIQEGFNIDDDKAKEKDVEEEEGVEEADDEYVMVEEDVKESSESEDDDDADEEMSLLKKMVDKLKNVVSRKEDEVVVEIERTEQNAGDANTDDNVNATDSATAAFEESQKGELDPMVYENRKSTGRRRRSKKDKDKNNLGGLMEKSSKADDTQDRNGDMEESHTVTFEDQSEYIEYKKTPRSKKSTRGMKSKVTLKKASNNKCDRCGEEFESRTKLFKHLAETGHAAVKSR